MDRLLDHARTGPLYPSRPEIAQIVVDALRYGQDVSRHYDLHAFVVMSNIWLGSLKSITAKRATQILDLTGRPFSQEESYDHVG